MMKPRKPPFREASLARLANPVQLNDYLSVTSVRMWLALAGVAALLISLLGWGVFGRVAIYERAQGYRTGGSVRLFVADPSGYRPGLAATVDGAPGQVTRVADAPISRDQLTATYGGYLAYALQAPEYSFEVNIDAPGVVDGPVSVTVIKDHVRPISFILGGGGDA